MSHKNEVPRGMHRFGIEIYCYGYDTGLRNRIFSRPDLSGIVNKIVAAEKLLVSIFCKSSYYCGYFKTRSLTINEN